MRHEVVECDAGAKALREALAKIDDSGRDVVSVVANQGGPIMAILGHGDSFGFLIVTRKRAQWPESPS